MITIFLAIPGFFAIDNNELKTSNMTI